MRNYFLLKKISLLFSLHFLLVSFCFSSLSCTPSTAYFQYELLAGNEEPYHFQKICSLPCQIQDQEATIYAAIVDNTNKPQLVFFTTDKSGRIIESVAFTPPDNWCLNRDILCWFPTQYSTYLVFETTTIDNEPVYQLHFLKIDSNALNNSLLQNVTTFSSTNVSLHNVCTISNHIFLSGSYNSTTIEYGLIVECVETEPSTITLQHATLLQIPTSAKKVQSTKAICSIIPDISSGKDESSVHFSTHNGFIGTFHPVEGVKNCYSVPGYNPSFQNTMFSNGENILIENHPQSSYDADFIQIYWNGKTDHIYLFNQYPDLSYQWIAKKRKYDGSLGLIVLGFQDNNEMFLVGEMDSDFSSIEGWLTQNRYQMKSLSHPSIEDAYLRMDGFFSPEESSVGDIQTNHSYLESGFCQNQERLLILEMFVHLKTCILSRMHYYFDLQ
ncbi:MAG: hypothetical protein PHI40_01135 [Caldisericia bacterium]|nr:hypothetical protein [Caldisericia bacterium]